MTGENDRRSPFRPGRFFAVVALVAIVAVAAWPAAGGGAGIPNLPKVPKVTAYPVTIDVAGYVDFNWTWDSQEQCFPGYSKTVSEELSFELGKPRRSVVNVIGGAVSMPFAIGGFAKHKATVDGYRTTNYCPPTSPEPEPPAPDCRTLSGKLAVALTPQSEGPGDDDLAPLGRGVMISIIRRNGSPQTQSCLADRPTPRAVKEDEGVLIETAPQPHGLLIVPLGTNSGRFTSLKPGARLFRTITIAGGCQTATATAKASVLSEHIKRCTIGGKIVVVIKRPK